MQNVFLACRNILRIFNYRKFIFKFLDHPNQEQYKQYEQQWKTYETQMNQKRHDIEQRKTALENQLKTGTGKWTSVWNTSGTKSVEQSTKFWKPMELSETRRVPK